MIETHSGNVLLNVVTAERLATGGSISRIFGASVKLPDTRSGMNMLLATEVQGRRQLLPAGAEADGKLQPALAIFVRSEPWPLALTLSRARKDAEGHAWDLVLTGTWRVLDAAKFVQEYAIGVVSPDAPLDGPEMQTWAMARIEHRMREEIASLSLEDLRDRKTRSPRFWEARMTDWLTSFGLSAVVSRMEMSSATAAAAQEQRSREQHERDVKARREAMRQQELADRSAEAQFEQSKVKIETDQLLAEDQRTAQLEKLEQDRQARRDQVEQARLAAAQEMERLRITHETEMADLGAKASEERLKRQQEAEASFHEKRREAKLKQVEQLQNLHAQRERLKSEVESGQYRAAAEKAELERKLVDLEYTQKQANNELSRQEVELNLKAREAELRQNQLKAEHEQALATASALNAARLTLLDQQEQARNDQQATFARQREAQSAALHEAKKEKILADRTLTEEARRIAIERENTLLRAARQKAEYDAEQATLSADRAKERHDGNLKLLALKLEREKAAIDSESAFARQLAGYHSALLDIIQQIPQTVAALVGNDRAKAHQAAETITHQWHTPAASLVAFGYAVTPQTLVDRWTRKAEIDKNPVDLRKQELATRDIGVSSVKVLKIGSSLHFSISSRRGGFITVINLGTSGKFWLLCPGSLCSIAHSRIMADRIYDLPGRELFPFAGGILEEQGPPGWEHLAAIVSDRPIVEESLLRGNPGPIVPISAEALERWVARLDERPNEWSAGILSFVVE